MLEEGQNSIDVKWHSNFEMSCEQNSTKTQKRRYTSNEIDKLNTLVSVELLENNCERTTVL